MGLRAWSVVGLGSLGISLAFAGGGAQGELHAAAAARSEAVVELGRRLFLDPTVSQGGKFSCADCHAPEHGFSDVRNFSSDENGPTARHSQPLSDPQGAGFHWDGEFFTLRQLLVARLGLPREALDQSRDLHTARFELSKEAGLTPDRATFEKRIQSLTPPYYGPVTPTGPGLTPIAISQRLTQDDRYDRGFEIAFGSQEITADRMIDAMDAYLQTLKSTEGPYDRFVRGDRDAISAAAKRGLGLFRGKAGCADCHTLDRKDTRAISDGEFHNTGVAFPVNVLPLELLEQAGLPTGASDVGRANMSFATANTGQFKTPNLRDVALRPPYMHDGGHATLRQVVQYYDAGGTPNAHLDPRVRELGLTDRNVDDIVAFLETLTGDTRVGLGPVPRYRKKRSSARRKLRVVDLAGKPLADFDVRVTPAGDRLQGTESMPRPFVARTDEDGYVDFDFPLSTHVVLGSDTHEIGLSRLLPDTLRKATFIATPFETVSVRLQLSDREHKLPPRFDAKPVWKDPTKTDATRITFEKVRELSRHEAVYSVAVGALRGERPMTVHLDPTNAHARGTFEIDLNGGASNPIDLRPLPRTTVTRRDVDRRRRRRPFNPTGNPRREPPTVGPSTGPKVPTPPVSRPSTTPTPGKVGGRPDTR